jgi:hypothetical protein
MAHLPSTFIGDSPDRGHRGADWSDAPEFDRKWPASHRASCDIVLRAGSSREKNFQKSSGLLPGKLKSNRERALGLFCRERRARVFHRSVFQLEVATAFSLAAFLGLVFGYFVG